MKLFETVSLLPIHFNSKSHPTRVAFAIGAGGIEQSQMQQSGGLLLSPVQKLVTTLIFAIGKNAYRFPSASHHNQGNCHADDIGRWLEVTSFGRVFFDMIRQASSSTYFFVIISKLFYE